MIRSLSILLISMFITATASALEVNPQRAMIIDGPIARGNTNHLGELLLSMDNSAPIDIIINSPGGDVVTGFMFVSRMKAAQAQGKVLRCFVTDVAASMAFQIFVNCNERYSLSRSFLLWHRARVYVGGMFGQPLTAPAAGAISVQLGLLDRMIFDETYAALGASRKYVSYHFENETLHVGSTLASAAPRFLRAFESIDGLLEILNDRKVPRMASTSILDLGNLYRDGQIIYIRRGLVD